MQFLMMVNGFHNGIARNKMKAFIPAIETRGIVGYWHNGKPYLPCKDSIRAALPKRWHKAFDRDGVLWTRENAARQFETILTTITDKRGKYIATVYFQPMEST